MFKSIIFNFLWLLMTHHLLAKSEEICSYGILQKISCLNCESKSLRTVPQNLKTNIQCLSLSENHIIKIYNDTFSRYPSIRRLNLHLNSIGKIESHAFAPLTNLEVLDISYYHALNLSDLYLPPTLRELYLDGISTISKLLPISSLEKLAHLSLIGCSLERLPEFDGVFPALETLDVTNNPLENFVVDDLTPLCSLKILNISLSNNFKSKCECQKLEKWAEDIEMNVVNMSCNVAKSGHLCDLGLSSAAMEKYNSCKSKAFRLKIYSWSLYGGGALTVIFCIVFLYWLCNYRKSSQRSCCCFCRKKKNMIDLRV